MLLADIIIWVGVILLVGFVGFFAVLLTAVVRFFRFLFRLLFGVGSHGQITVPPPRPGGRLCTNPLCGHQSAGGARYCGRCGQALGSAVDVDRYG